IADELQTIAVAGADQHLHTGGLGFCAQGRDDVVGLISVFADCTDSHRVKHLLNQRDLALELIGSLVAGALIVGIRLCPEGISRHIKCDGDMRGILIADHIDQHLGKTEHGVGVLAGAGRKILHRQSEKCAVRYRMSVDEQDAVHYSSVSPGYGHSRPTSPTGLIPIMRPCPATLSCLTVLPPCPATLSCHTIGVPDTDRTARCS